MAICPYCTTPIDEAYNFCLECDKQVKCVKCSGYLVKDKAKCFVCGTPIVLEEPTQQQMNNYTLKEIQTKNSYSKEINLSFTDKAIEKAAPVLANYIPTNNFKSKASNIAAKNIQLPSSTNQNDDDYVEFKEQSEENVDEQNTVIEQKDSESQNDPNKYFKKDSKNFLIIQYLDLKGGSKKQQQERFILLYIWAYNSTMDKPVPSKDHLIEAARKNGFYDKNFSTYINRSANFLDKTDSVYKLNPAGKDIVNKILSEIQSNNLVGYNMATPANKSVIKINRIKETDMRKINEWLEKPSKLSDFDIRNISKVKLVILTVYDITKIIKGDETVSSSYVYNYLSKRNKANPLTTKGISDALTSKTNLKYFVKTQDNKFYLTPEADKIAQELLKV